MIHIDAENSTTAGELADLKWVLRDIGRGSPSPMSRTGGFATMYATEQAKRAKTPLLDRDETQPKKVTMNTIEDLDAKAREDIAMSERVSQTAVPMSHRSIGSAGEAEPAADDTLQS